MNKKATIYTIADKADVSISTVSRVFNKTFRGDDAVRRKVEEVMASLNYQPRPEARMMMGKKVESRMVGIMAPFFTDPFFVEVLKGLYGVIHANDYSVLLYDVDTKMMKKKIIRKILEERFLDGLLMVNMRLNDQEYEAISDMMPLVLVAAEHEHSDYVLVDNYDGIVQGMHYLHELGHRNIAFINNEIEICETRIREKAFRDEAERLDIQYKIDYRSVDRRGGYLGAKNIVDNSPDVTCLFYYSDLMAYGGLDYLNEHKLQERISIIGFDGFEMSFQMGLTTIVQPMVKMGETGAQILMDKILTKTIERRALVLKTWLEYGKTCRRVHNEQ